jgi:protease IV
MALAIVLLIVLVGVVIYHGARLFSGGLMHARGIHSSGPRLEEVTTEENQAGDKILLIPLNGIITSQSIDQSGFSMVEVIKAQLKRALEDDHVKAVILKVDSPGGEVLASDEIYRAISDFQRKRSGKPVIASMGNLAASGGYYVSAPCRWIVANDLTITGSIGVIMHGWNYRHLMDKVGILPQVYKSGKHKDMLSGDREPTDIPDEERGMIQALIDETYGKFKNVVADGRAWAHAKNQDAGRALAESWSDYADGRVLSGSEAYKLGFVDQLGTFEDAVERAKRIAGITSANLIEYQQRIDLSDLLRLFGKSDAKVFKVDVGLEIPKLQAGQLYFLWPLYLH